MVHRFALCAALVSMLVACGDDGSSGGDNTPTNTGSVDAGTDANAQDAGDQDTGSQDVGADGSVEPGYEVWASDQSNSVAGAGRGTDGSYIWIWDSADVQAQLSSGVSATPLGCVEGEVGPCDLHDVFPGALEQLGADGQPTGATLAELDGFGRLHGMLPDPQNLYVTVNIFAPGGGYVGIIDTRTKEAVALFRASQSSSGSGDNTRSVHMSFWTADGSAVVVANLHGKLLERIDVTRDAEGNLTSAVFNRSATLGVGRGMSITESATAFRGLNQHGNGLIGEVSGDYDMTAGLGDLTPGGVCKENGCEAGDDAPNGGRPNNVIICPITSTHGLAYITMGGGGLLVADTRETPMAIRGEYGNATINGAGCGGGQTGDWMWINAGVSASEAGGVWSTFTMYRLDDTRFGTTNPPDTPAPELVFRDPSNTAHGGGQTGAESNMTGQLPGTTTRRDAHGVAVTVDSAYIHNVDRVRNVVEVFDVAGERTTYDLTSEDGQGNGVGPCAAASVTDDPGLPINDPAPDLLQRTPDGKHLMIAFRGPAPVSVTHSAQGSCPGVGIVELLDGGRLGRLVGVLRTTNTVDDAPVSAPGGHAYTGAERSDIHAATVIQR